MRGSIWILGIAMAAACGGGDDGVSPAAPLDEQQRADACGEYCDQEVACGDADGTECLAWCESLAGVIRGDAAQALLDCYREIPCGEASEQGCLGDVIDATTPSDAYHTANQACHDVESRCGTYYACDITFFVILSDPTLDALTDCFALECDAVDACLADALE